MKTIQVQGGWLTALSRGIYAFHKEEHGEQTIITVDAAFGLIQSTVKYGYMPR